MEENQNNSLNENKFINVDFNIYQLPDYNEFIEIINICASYDKLFRLLPNLLRNLLENILSEIYLEGLANIHREFYFFKGRSRDFSQLIHLLNILKDNLFKSYHNNTITQNTITELNKLRDLGNINVHGVIRTIDSSFKDEWEEPIDRLLNTLLHMYRKLKGEKLEITDPKIVEKISIKLNIELNGHKKKYRKRIELIYKMKKEEMLDLIIEIPFPELYSLINKIFIELKLISDFNEYSSKLKLYDFVLYTLEIRDDTEEITKIFDLLLNKILVKNLNFMWKFYEKLPDLIKEEVIQKYIIDKNYIDSLIDIFVRSNNSENAKRNSMILIKFKENLDENQVNKIIKGFLVNEQIHNTYNVPKIMEILLNDHESKISPFLIRKLKYKGVSFY